jgi:glyoxylase-like metal-dependent hydrolase (beta-lactamase superfamily II)
MKNDPGRPVPTITFDDTYTLSVGDQILELSYVGAFHSKGDILIYAPQQKVLMAVDIFHPSHAPFKNFAITKDINNYILVHDKMLEYDFDAIISGHQQILGTSDDVKTNKEFTLDVLNNTIQGFQTWDFMEVAQQYGSEGMLTIFSKYIDLVTSTCVDLTLEKWEDRLSDVSIFVEGNCDSMFFYAFID